MMKSFIIKNLFLLFSILFSIANYGEESAWVYVTKGDNYLAENNIDDAIYHYKKALNIDMYLPNANFKLGKVYYNTGDFIDAIYYFNRARAYQELSLEKNRLNNAALKFANSRIIILRFDKTRRLELLDYLKKNGFSTNVNEYDKIYRTKMKNNDIFYHNGIILMNKICSYLTDVLEKNKDYNTAIDALFFQLGYPALLNNSETKFDNDIFLKRLAFQETHHYSRVVDELEDILRIGIKKFITQNNIEIKRQQSDNYFLKNFGIKVEKHFNKGDFRNLSQDEIVNIFIQIEDKLSASNYTVFTKLGRLFYRLNNFDYADKFFKKSVSYKENQPEAYYFLTEIAIRDRDIENANFFLKKAEEYGFDRNKLARLRLKIKQE